METPAVARLTEREKDCLRRWLAHQTAKEIALDLGITPHAVEKRLKMARAKLGVSSSLGAARLLAEAEGYQHAGAQSPDLVSAGAAPDNRRHRQLALGVLTMTILAATVLILAMQASDTPARGGVAPLPTTIGGVATLPAPDASAGPQVIYGAYNVGTLVKVEPDELPAVLGRAFRQLDTNGSGFIEANEAPMAARVTFKLGTATQPAPAPTQVTGAEAQAKWIADGDRDGNGKLDEQEYADWLGPLYAAHGLPVELVETAQ